MTKITTKSIVEKIRKSAPSKLVNCWRVKFGNKYYAITPAHVAIYPKNKIWTKSPFLRELNQLEWKMPSNYHLTQSLTEDFAWAEIPKPGEQHYLDHTEDIITDPVNVNFYFRQPYDIKGKWQEDSSFVALNATLFQSPKSELVEALEVGFRGMSGAIAIGELGKFHGILVRRGAVQDIKDPISRISNENMEDENLEIISKPCENLKSNPINIISKSFIVNSDITRSYQTPDTRVNPQSDLNSESRILKMLEKLMNKNDENFQRIDENFQMIGKNLDENFQRIDENFQRIDENFQRIDRNFLKIERNFQKIEGKINDLDKSVLKKIHMNQLLSIVGLRRLIIIPWNIMSQLIYKPCVHLDKIAGLEYQLKYEEF